MSKYKKLKDLVFGGGKKGNNPVNPTGPLAQTGAGAGVGAGIARYGLYRGIGDALSDDGQTIIMPGEASSGLGGMGFGGGSQTLTPASAATSALSDADSSDPVVRQLQDIERVLVSIKGDTAMMAAGFSKLGSAGSGGPQRPMFAGPDKVTKSSTTAALLAGLAAMLAGSAAKGGNSADNNGDGIPDNQQDREDVIVQKETDEQIVRAATSKTTGRVLEKVGRDATGEVVEAAGKEAGQAVAREGAEAAGKGVASVLQEVEPPKRSKILDASGKPFEMPDGKVSTTTGASEKPKVGDKLKKMMDAGKIPAKEEIMKVAGKHLAKLGAKAAPIAGRVIGIGFAIDKLLNGDFIGAAEELGASAAPFPGADIIAGAGVAARDIYRAVYYPEADANKTAEGYETDLYNYGSDFANARMEGIAEIVQQYALDLMEEMAGEKPVTTPVEARPEVTTPVGRGRMQNAKRLSEQKAQAEWDDKYGMTHNADGSLKDPEAAAAIEAERANSVHNSNIFERMGTRGKRELDDMIEVGTEIGTAAGSLYDEVTDPNRLRVNAESVEITTDDASQASVDADTERMTGAMLASSTVQGSTASPPSAQNPLSVSIVGPKSALPITDLHSMQMIANRGTFYLPA